jgi:hypothetical protein
MYLLIYSFILFRLEMTRSCMLCYINYHYSFVYFQVMKFQVPSKNKYEKTLSFPIEQHKSCECGCKVNATSIHKFLCISISPAARIPFAK